MLKDRCSIVLSVVTEACEAGVLRDDPETVAYALWAAAHGMAMLQLTHLAGFDAGFDAADRAAFEALLAGLCVAGLVVATARRR